MVLIFGEMKNLNSCMSLDTTNVIVREKNAASLPPAVLPGIFLEYVGQDYLNIYLGKYPQGSKNTKNIKSNIKKSKL